MDDVVANLSDNELLALCALTMSEEQQSELADLLADQREGLLTATKENRLNELMQVCRQGLVRTSEALRVAAKRGLSILIY